MTDLGLSNNKKKIAQLLCFKRLGIQYCGLADSNS